MDIIKNKIQELFDLKKSVINSALSTSTDKDRSNVSESEYYHTEYGKVRVSGHPYPTGDMTNVSLSVYDTFHFNGVYRLALKMGLNDVAKQIESLLNEIDLLQDKKKREEIEAKKEISRKVLSTGIQNDDVTVKDVTVFFKNKQALKDFKASCKNFNENLFIIYKKI